MTLLPHPEEGSEAGYANRPQKVRQVSVDQLRINLGDKPVNAGASEQSGKGRGLTLWRAVPFTTARVCQGQLKKVTTSPSFKAPQRLDSTTPTPPPSTHSPSCHGVK